MPTVSGCAVGRGCAVCANAVNETTSATEARYGFIIALLLWMAGGEF
jgi:hypothetical protein